MAMVHSQMSATYELALNVFNYFFTFIYNAECLIKFIAYSWKYFTVDPWNRFDFV